MSEAHGYQTRNGRPVLPVRTLEPSALQAPISAPTARPPRLHQMGGQAMVRLNLVLFLVGSTIGLGLSNLSAEPPSSAVGAQTASIKAQRDRSPVASSRHPDFVLRQARLASASQRHSSHAIETR